MPLSHVMLAVVVAAIWGLNFVAIAIGLRDFPPILFCALRFALAATPLLFILWQTGHRQPPIPWRYLVGIGFVLGVVKFSLLFIAINIGMPAGLASLVLQSQAFFTALLAIPLLGDRPGLKQMIGMTVAFAGIALIATGLPTSASLWGLGLSIAAAAAWGVSNILMKQVQTASATPPNLFTMMVWISLIPPLPLLALSAMVEGTDSWATAYAGLGWVGIGSLVYIAGAATLIGFAAWGFLLRHHPASLVAPFSLLVPIFGMSSSALFLGETLTALKVAGAALVFAGLAITVLNRQVRT